MNLNDKDIANDILESSKHGISDLTKVGLECSNQRLRQTLRQMRDQDEKSHEKFTQMAVQNQWYLPSSKAEHAECRRVEQFLTAGGRTGIGPETTAGYGTPHEYQEPRPPLR